MLVEQTKTQIIQYPDTEGNFLWKDFVNEYTGETTRQFGKSIKHDAEQPLWGECTPQEKAEWEAAHSTETLNERVTRLIRRQYDQSQENHMNRIGGKIVMNLATEEEKAEWLAFNTYVEECIERAKQPEPEPIND